MINREIVEAFSAVAMEKNIDRRSLADIIKGIFETMILKKYDTLDGFDVIVNLDKGEIEIYRFKTIVKEVTEPDSEISVEDAQLVEPDLDIGDEFIEIIDIDTFGRRLVASAKQNLAQRIKDAEKEIVMDEYKDRLGEVIIGDIYQERRRDIYIMVGKTEVILPEREQIPGERYRRGNSIRAVINAVEATMRGPEIIVSRASSNFLVRLFEIEVPEIFDGIVEIKTVARIAGERSKIAVISNDKRIDPVGACVGMKGIRIQSIVRELNNEKIDIIPWSDNPLIYIQRALSPAKPISTEIDEERKKATIIVPDEEYAIAIGKNGQNITLSNQLTGYEIEVLRESDEELKGDLLIDQVEGLTKSMVAKLSEGGFERAEDILDAGVEGLKGVKGIGVKSAEKILSAIGIYFEEVE